MLRHGRASRFARWFDIDWDRPSDKVLLPILGRPLDEVLAAGELTARAATMLRYFSHRLPLARQRGDRGDVLERQH